MDARERRNSHWIFDNACLSLKQTDVKLGLCRFCFRKIDDGGMVGVYLEVTRCHLPSTWVRIDSLFLPLNERGRGYIPSFKRIDFIRTFSMKGI